jgi:hypothetical protein
MHVQGNDGWESAGKWFRQVFWRVAAGILVVVALPGCRASNVKGGTMNLTSTSFQGNQIPAKFTCDGAGISPQLTWSAPPAGTASFALIVTDPDAPGRTGLRPTYGRPATGTQRFWRDRLRRPLSSREFSSSLPLHAICAGCEVESARGRDACAGRSRHTRPHPGARGADWVVSAVGGKGGNRGQP